MVVRTEQVASPARAREDETDWYRNRLRHYPDTIHELSTGRSWRRLFRRRVVPGEAVADLAALHPRGPVYHFQEDDRLVVLTPVEDVSPPLVESAPTGRVYYGSPRLSVVLEEDPRRRHDVLDLAANDLTVREGLDGFRPIVRRDPYESAGGVPLERRPDE
ncbi:hypothetical protein BRD00_02410 [Halobacteriales archaeon QS_8_69_26]|nr:MAG: hypothetical protein BRD00_02410 [Halobacteriales archaeon QS_8_69_26]